MVQAPVNQVGINNNPGEMQNPLSPWAIDVLSFMEQLSKKQPIYVHELMRAHPNRRQSMLDALTELRLNQCVVCQDQSIILTDKAKMYIDVGHEREYLKINSGMSLKHEKTGLVEKEDVVRVKRSCINSHNHVKHKKNDEIIHINGVSMTIASSAHNKNTTNTWV